MENNKNRFVKLKTGLPESEEFDITFLEATKRETASENEIIKKITETDSEKAEKLKLLFEELLKSNSQFFDWIEATSENSTLFMKDPFTAIKRALPSIPTELFDI